MGRRRRWWLLRELAIFFQYLDTCHIPFVPFEDLLLEKSVCFEARVIAFFFKEYGPDDTRVISEHFESFRYSCIFNTHLRWYDYCIYLLLTIYIIIVHSQRLKLCELLALELFRLQET
jgi:hypothetical protein